MAEAVGLVASLLTITAACRAVKSLYETVKLYEGRNTTLTMLRAQLEETINIMNALEKVTGIQESLWVLLQGPIDRCKEMCPAFEEAMKSFGGAKSKIGIRDWAKMEFRQGTITDFVDRISSYKSTIAVGLGIINLHSSNASQEVLREYMVMTQMTSDELKLQLQRINEKMAEFSPGDASSTDVSLDLKDEKAVTQQCLRICQDAKGFIESLTRRQSSILPETPSNASGHAVQQAFEAQLATRQVMDESRDKLAATMNRLVRRLDHLVQGRGIDASEERQRLQDELEISMQCLEVCKVASEVTRQKIYRVGETSADGNSDLVVVNTLSDLFDVGTARASDNSAHLVASLTSEDFQEVVAQRYKSRFGAVATNSSPSETDAGAGASKSPSLDQIQSTRAATQMASGSAQRDEDKSSRKRPSPNEPRKRSMRNDDG